MSRVHRLFGSAEEVEAAFYEALAKADIQALMDIWADEEEVVCIHPGGDRLIGLAAIRQSYEAIFEQGALPLEPTQLRVLNSLTSSIHHVIERMNTSQSEASLAFMGVFASNVYVKYPQGWRLVLHHASPVHELSQVELGTARPGVLH